MVRNRDYHLAGTRLMKIKDVLSELESLATKDPESMAVRRGVPVETLLGVSTGEIRKLAKQLGQNDRLAKQLWRTGIHEARSLAILVASFDTKTLAELGVWVSDIDSWDICDHFAKKLALEVADVSPLTTKWIASDALYTKRAGLALIANHCMKRKALESDACESFLDQIKQCSTDERQHVKQASCWALRELGKIDTGTHEMAIALALELQASADKTELWVGNCAYKELEALVKIPERRRLIARTSKTASKYKNL